MTDFVLVHGAWHGGWCYGRVADILRRKGHRVATPTMTGLGERSHLFSGAINLTTHITDIVNTIRWEGLDRVVLLGHSYGGMVISGVADRIPAKIASLVYLDAVIPGDNQSIYDLVPPEIAKLQIDGAAANGGFAIPATPAAAFNVNPKDRAWVDAMCTPQPIGCMNERLKLTGGASRVARKMFILAADWGDGRGFRRQRDKIMADPSWIKHEMPCGHDAMIDMPERLVELLEEAAP